MTLECGGNFVVRQTLPQRRRYSLIEQYAHLRRSERAARRMFKHGANLFQGDAGKPFHELSYRRAVFEILE